MASLGKMSIRGIRAFSPDRDETIEFYSPLTMIVGANGCGKTTIIECLKYSCTGSLPPGTRSGQSFINDPSMTEAIEVKANIKLRFTNRQSNPTVVVRSFQLTKKRTKMEFKALDGVVRMTDKDGEKVSLTQKCSELDKHIPDLLGVSKAIMENVVFCHQEDSNWPLQEGALLKKKFDDIFESTRYSKALDAISKSKKEFVMKCKDLQKDVAELNAYLHSANDMRESLQQNQLKVEECAEELDAVENSIGRTEDKLRSTREEVNRIQSMQQALQQLEWQVDELSRRAEEKGESLDKTFDETDDELQDMYINFDREMGALTQEYSEIEDLVQQCHREISMLRSRQDESNRRHGEVAATEKQLQDQTTSTFKNMKSFSRAHGVSEAQLVPLREGDKWDSAVASKFVTACRARIDGLVSELNSSLSANRESVQRSESSFVTAKSGAQNLNIAVSEKNKELNRLESDRAVVTREMASSGGSGGRASARGRRSEAEADYNRCNDELISYQETATAKMNRVKSQTSECLDRIRELDGLITADDNALRELSLNRAEMERLTAMQRQCDTDNEACLADGTSLLSKYVKSGLPSESAPASLRSVEDVSALSAVLSTQLRELKATQASKRAAVDSCKRMVYQTGAALQADEKRQQELRVKISSSDGIMKALSQCLVKVNAIRREEKFQIPGELYRELTASDPMCTIEDALRDIDEELSNVNTFMESSKLWRDKLIKRASKPRRGSAGNFTCPCCDRGMDAGEKTTFEEKVNDLFKAADADNGKGKQKLDEFKLLQKETSELLQSLRPFEEYKSDLAVIDGRLASQKEQLEAARAEDAAASAELVPIEKQLESIQQIQMSVQSLLSRWTDISQRIEDLKSRKQRHENNVSQSLGMSDQRSYQQIEDDRRSRGAERDDLQRKKDALVEEENRISKQFQSLKLMVSEAEKTLMAARSLEKRQDELEGRLTDLSSREEGILEDITRIKREIIEADREVSAAESILKSERDKLRIEEGQVQAESLTLRGELDSLTRAVKATDDQAKKLSTMTPSIQIKRDIDAAAESIASKEGLLKEYQPKMALIHTQITQQEQVRKVVQDNINFRSVCQELEAKKTELNEKKAAAMDMDASFDRGGKNSRNNKSGDFGVNFLNNKKRELQRADQEYHRLSDTRASLSGRLSTLKEQTEEYELKLNSPQFRSIDERCRRKNIEYETTQMACTDLDSYFNALDRALLNFHTLKIKEVNKIIKELWQLIYRGEDIDNIEIVSGIDAAEGGAPSGGRADKSFNYRVVMKKGDSPMEMRGRCSAGQRVLACIVIRLALAETFCLNCGILALDEPTTNLDELNKAGLAHALARIISNRARQHNFQLICITHDEDFVRIMSMELAALSNFSLPEHYFRICRVDNTHTGKFFSHIERIPWGDM